MSRIKTLIHVHTNYSYDSNISLPTLARFAEAEGFGCIAVTDHDTIEGARRLQAMTTAKVIIGEEVTASVKIIKIREDKPIITLRTLCVNAAGDVAIEGEAVVKIP